MKTYNIEQYTICGDIYISFWNLLIIKTDIYFGNSFSTLIFAVRF